MSMDSELNACPFCGGTAKIAYDDSPCYHGSHGDYFGRCTKCGTMGARRGSKEEAVALWNQRFIILQGDLGGTA